jgi:hypothetical protein
MIHRIKVVLSALMLAIILLTLGGCAAPPSRGGEELGELRGGSGRPPYGKSPWSHPAPGA